MPGSEGRLILLLAHSAAHARAHMNMNGLADGVAGAAAWQVRFRPAGVYILISMIRVGCQAAAAPAPACRASKRD